MRFQLSLLLIILLSGCERGLPPEEFWEFTVQGAYSAAIHPDARHVLIGSIHHGGSLWQIQKFERMFNWNHREGESTNILTCDFSPEGKFAVTTDNRTLVLWNTESGDAVWFWNAPGDIKDISLTEDGNLALLGMADFTATLFNIKDGGIIRAFPHEGIVEAVDIKPDSTVAMTGSDDSFVRIWDIPSGKLLHKLPQDNQVKLVKLSDDGRKGFSAALRGRSIIWEIKTGQPLVQLPITNGHYSSAVFSANNSELLTGNSAGIVELWDAVTGEQKARWVAPPKNTWVSNNVYIVDVAISNGNYYAVGANGRVYRYRLN